MVKTKRKPKASHCPSYPGYSPGTVWCAFDDGEVLARV
jgi:hypothetical protein